MEPEKVTAIFQRLASAPAADAGTIAVEQSATLWVRYRDGIAAAATGYSQGWVVYRDNTRLVGSYFTVRDSALAKQILGLTALVKEQEGKGVR